MRPPTPSPLGATSRARRAVLIGAAIVPLLLATQAALAATLEPTTSGASGVLPVGVEPPPDPPAPDDYALCDHGHYSATGRGTVLKTAAPNGRTTKEGCESAKQGFHVPTEGATAQTECAVGTYQDERGKRLCKDAVAGQFVSTVRAKAPELCPAGTYGVKARAVSAADGCRPAEAGSFVANAGSAATTPCAAGTYQPDAGKTSCIAAAAGFFVPSAGAKSQTPCPTATTTGSKTCSAAAPAPEPPPTQESEDEDDEAVTDDGFVRPDGDPCPAGTWSPDGLVPTASSCTPASPGTFVSEAGASEEVACPAGSYSGAFGATECTLAAVGSYVPTEGATAQLPCPSATEPGASVCGDPLAAGDEASSGGLLPFLVAGVAVLVVVAAFVLLRQRGLLGGSRVLPASGDAWAGFDDAAPRATERFDAPPRAPEPRPFSADPPPAPPSRPTRRLDDVRFDDDFDDL